MVNTKISNSSLNVFDFVESFSSLLELLVHGQKVLDAGVHPRMLPDQEDDVFHLKVEKKSTLVR